MSVIKYESSMAEFENYCHKEFKMKIICGWLSTVLLQ